MPLLVSSGTPTFNGDSSCTINTPDRLQAPAVLLDKTQGWWAARLSPPYASAGSATDKTVLAWSEQSFSFADIIVLAWRGGTDLSWDFRRETTGSSLQLLVPDSFALGDHITVIAAWTPTTTKASSKGAAFTSQANTEIPDNLQGTFTIGSTGVPGNYGDFTFYWVAAGNGTLTDADASTINAFGDTDPTLAALPGNPTFLWAANDLSFDASGSSFAPRRMPLGG